MAAFAATSLASVVRFSEPWWLLLAAAGLVPPVAAAWARRRGRHIPATGVALQVLAVVLAAGALARPALPLGDRSAAAYLVLRDVSDSTRTQAEAPLPWAADTPPEHYDFAAGVARTRQDRPEPHAGLARDRTYLGPALRLAVAQRDRLAGVVIRTDGQFQDPDWPAAAEELARAGLDVLIVPMDSPSPDARIADLAADRDANGRVALRITVSANAPLARRLILRRRGVAAPLLDRRLSLLPASPATLRLTDDAPTDRAAVYEAALSAADEFPENDSASAIVLPRRQRVAVVAAPGADVPALAEALGAALTAIDASEAPTDATGWLDYAAVILIDARGTLLGPAQRSALAEYVRGGGGLVLVGAAPHEVPADRDDPLTRVAALVANPFERRPMKVSVVLDASGSMAEQAADPAGRRIKFDAAVEAVLSLKRHLTRKDLLSVITFSDSASRVYDSPATGPDFAALRDALAAVRPTGPTDVMAGIRLAAEAPTPAGRIGLVILLSDLVPTRPFDPAAAAALLRSRRLRLAVVGTTPPGEPAPETAPLRQLAKALGAPIKTRDRLTGLAEVFADFVKQARGEAIRRGRLKAAGSGSVFGRPIESMPALDAYVLSGAREADEVMLRTGDDDPLLARRRAGLGRSVCLAVPLTAEHNQPLRRSRYLAGLLAAATRWAWREGDDPRFDGQVRPTPRGLEVVVTARDANGPMNDLALTAHCARPDKPGGAADPAARLVQTAPGRYEARMADPGGPAALAVRDESGRAVYRQALGRGPPPELARIGPDWEALRRLADRAGGRIASSADVIGHSRRWDLGRYTPVWPAVLALALAVMLLEWCLVRVWRRPA